mgnify:CR=1 FL=1
MESAKGVISRSKGAAVTVETILVPDPGPGEVRISQSHIGVNFIDIYCRTGYFDLVTPPGVPGMEAAGVVEAAIQEAYDHGIFGPQGLLKGKVELKVDCFLHRSAGASVNQPLPAASAPMRRMAWPPIFREPFTWRDQIIRNRQGWRGLSR